MPKRGKLLCFIALFLFFLAGYATAANETNVINKTAAFDWLYKQMNSSDWNKNPSEIALSILALKGQGYDVEGGIKKLKDIKTGNNWGNGDIKYTSLAILALHESGENVSKEIEWLEDQHKKSMTGGTWYVQLDSSEGNGICVLKYNDDDFRFDVNGTDVTQTEPDYCTSPSPWINFVNCIKRDENINIKESIDVRCNPSDITSSVIFQTSDNEYHIIDEGSPLNIENGCFYWQQSCNCEYTGYASWVLKEVGSESYVKPYLMSNCINAEGYSFLYILTNDNFYSGWLEKKQEDGGSWGSQNLKTTYISLLALKKYGKKTGAYIDNAVDFIGLFQSSNDGSWKQNIEDTAFILYVLYSKDVLVPSSTGGWCGDGFIKGLEECEEDTDCNSTQEKCFECECVLKDTVPTNYTSSKCGNGIKDFGEECDGFDLGEEECTDLGYASGTLSCKSSCVLDKSSCECGSGEEYDYSKAKCEKKSSWLKWIIVVLVVLVGVGLIYFIYTKYFKNKKGGSESFSPYPKQPYRMTKQRVPIRRAPPVMTSNYSAKDSKIERELEESLKRAKELLKK